MRTARSPCRVAAADFANSHAGCEPRVCRSATVACRCRHLALTTISTAPERFRTLVLGIIAMLGLVLAAVGISGMTYRSVIDRSRAVAVLTTKVALAINQQVADAPLLRHTHHRVVHSGITVRVVFT